MNIKNVIIGAMVGIGISCLFAGGFSVSVGLSGAVIGGLLGGVLGGVRRWTGKRLGK